MMGFAPLDNPAVASTVTIVATIDDFHKLDIRVGRVVQVHDFPEAKKPAYQLAIDFGPEIGIKKSSVQITHLYEKEELLGKLILGVVNFPPRKIGPFESETLTLGVPDEEGRVILVVPDRGNPLLGGKLF
jgi:tRNA-binding protein